ncbi:hypothetical protein [Photobacterium leiognathi]|uniref:hypothetical protein n=1 Tax=Photobacterium leiognathi TaxID=553611 RepID=UPI0029822466|nr:hypothetical protein [Photobacterium leiognathi]
MDFRTLLSEHFDDQVYKAAQACNKSQAQVRNLKSTNPDVVELADGRFLVLRKNNIILDKDDLEIRKGVARR